LTDPWFADAARSGDTANRTHRKAYRRAGPTQTFTTRIVNQLGAAESPRIEPLGTRVRAERRIIALKARCVNPSRVLGAPTGSVF
jgi:hypothetical protein